MRRTLPALLIALSLPLVVSAAPKESEQKLHPSTSPALPAYVQRVQPAVVGIRVQVPPDRPSALTLGPERWGGGVIFDPAGYAVTVSYVLLDAETIRVTLRDGRVVPAKLVGLDLEHGLGVIKLEGNGPWPAAVLGDSSKVAPGDLTGTIGVDEDNDLVVTQGSVKEVRGFTGYWEYMLDRAFVVAPSNPAFGGSPLVNVQGELIGVASLRLGERPFVNLAIPIEHLASARDELIKQGRVVSRRPRPWLGLYTVPVAEGVVVAGVSPVGPARQAGFQRGDVIVRVNGETIGSQEEFYRKLWKTEVGQEVTVVVVRESRFHAITVRPADRYQFFRTIGK
jgi:S1-C subfamily serine protease